MALTLQGYLGEIRHRRLAAEAAKSTVFGLPVGDLSRDDLLALVGFLSEQGAGAAQTHTHERDMLLGLARRKATG